MKKVYSLLIVFSCLSFSTVYSQYHFNKAAKFGTGRYYSSVSEANFDFNAAITIEAWIKIDSVDVDMMIAGKNFNTGYALGLRQSGATCILRLNIGGQFVNGTAELPLNTWVHVAATYDGVNTPLLFINGVNDPVSFGTITGAVPANDDDFRIGCDQFGGVPAFFFKGAIDEVRIWDAALSQTQIRNNMNTPLGIDYGSGNVYASAEEAFRMNVQTPNDTMRSEVWPYHQMLPHNIQLVNLSNKTSPYVNYNSSLVFDGSDEYRIEYNGPSTDMYIGTSFTAEVWARYDSLGAASFMNIFNQSGGTNEYPFGIYLSPADGTVFFEVNGGAVVGVSGGNIRDNQWHHLAGTYNGTTGYAQLFVDGILVDSMTASPAILPAQSSYYWYMGSIGASSFATNRLTGQVDEARLWRNVVRTPAEIKKYMYVGLDASVNDPDIDSLVVFGLDGITRESNVDIGMALPKYYGNFLAGSDAYFASSKRNTNATPTSPLLRYDALNYPQEFIISPKKQKIIDNSTIRDTISITGLQPFQPLLVETFLLLNHTYVGDLEIYLFSPNGDSIRLADDGGCSGNDLMTIFTMSADSVYSPSCSPINMVPSSPAVKPFDNMDGVMQGSPNGNWRIRITDVANGDAGYVQAWGLKVKGNSIGIEPEKEDAFLVYNFPNPLDDMTTVYFELKQPGEVELVIYDQAGRKVMQRMISDAMNGSNYYTLDMTAFAAGIYYYEVVAKEGRVVNKMIVK